MMFPRKQNGIDVILIQPPIRDYYLTAKRTIPYGLISIAACLVDHGFTVQVFDALATAKSKPEKTLSEFSYLGEFYGKPDVSPFCLFNRFRYFGYRLEHIAKVVKASKARIAGISSLFTAYGEEALSVAHAVKKVLPGCTVVLGGHHPTAMPEKVMECEDVDFVIRGEGELAFPSFIKALNTNTDQNLENVPGIVFRRHDGTLFINSPAIVANPDDFPIPAMDMVKSTYYQRRNTPSMVVVSSRGCPMKCSYCCVGDSTIPYRRRNVSSVLAEIDMAVRKHQTGFIDFEDENISLDRKWFKNLLEKIIQRYGEGRLELRAMNGLFPPSLDEKTIRLMKRAGFKTLNLSIGTLSTSQLKKFNRPDMMESLEQVLISAQKYDLNSVCYLIAGAPGQKAEDTLFDLIYLAQKPVVVGLSIFYPAPGSTDYTYLEKKGLLPEHVSMMRSSALPVSQETTRIEAVTLLRLSRIINFMKLIIGRGEKIPESTGCLNEKMADMSDRTVIGRQLLSWFLHDGFIRGVNPQGEIFIHKASIPLTRRFLDNMRHIRLFQQEKPN